MTRIQELSRVDEAYAYTASESLKEETPQIYYDMNSVIVEKMFRYYKVHKSNVHNRRFFHLTDKQHKILTRDTESYAIISELSLLGM